MTKRPKSLDKLVENLEERAKELNCLYAIEEILQNVTSNMNDILKQVVDIIPSAMQYPEICKVKIIYQDLIFTSTDFKTSQWATSEEITVQDRVVGWIKVHYIEEKPLADDGPFLKEEKRVLNSIARRIGQFAMYQKMRQIFHQMDLTKKVISEHKADEWRAVLDLLRRSDPDVYTRISRKMLNHLDLAWGQRS